MTSRTLPSPSVTFQFISRAPISGRARKDEAPTCHLKMVCPRYGMRSMDYLGKAKGTLRSKPKSVKLYSHRRWPGRREVAGRNRARSIQEKPAVAVERNRIAATVDFHPQVLAGLHRDAELAGLLEGLGFTPRQRALEQGDVVEILDDLDARGFDGREDEGLGGLGLDGRGRGLGRLARGLRR